MKIIPLGTNGFFPSFKRQTACYAVPMGNRLIIFDAGSGLFRLAESNGRKLLQKAGEIDLFLSHYHLDHTFGFYAAFKLLAGKKVSVYGSHKRQVFAELIKLKQFPIDYEREHKNFTWKTVREGENKSTGYKIRVRKQHHRGEGSLAYRFEFPGGKSLAYVTDSEPREEGIEFVRGADLLLHEHDKAGKGSKYNTGTKLERLYEGGHVTTEGAALIARRAGVKKMYLIHHNPFAKNEELEKDLENAKKIFPASNLAKDLEEISF